MKLWQESFAIFYEHPLLGVGSGAWGHASSFITPGLAHNTFLSVLAELGLIGISLFGSILAIVGQQALKQPKWDSMLWLTVLAIWLIGVSTLSWEFRKQTWFFLSFIVISANLFRKHDKIAEVSKSSIHSLDAQTL